MKLNKNLKERIDNYFAGISAEELYSILTDKYDFTNVDAVFVDEGEYPNMSDTLSNAYRKFIFYVEESKIVQTFESVDVKFVKDSSDIKDAEVVYDEKCTIPFAA